MIEIITTKTIGMFDGMSVSAAGVVDLKFKLPYEEMPNYIQISQMLNNNIQASIKIPPEEDAIVGEFMVKHLNIAGDGEAKFCINTITDSAELDTINDLITVERGTKLIITLRAEIEIEEEDEQISGQMDIDDWEPGSKEDDWEDEEADWRDNDSWGDDEENDKESW